MEIETAMDEQLSSIVTELVIGRPPFGEATLDSVSFSHLSLGSHNSATLNVNNVAALR